MQRSDRLFSKQAPWLPLWQELAEQYHPQRAEFTRVRSDHAEYAEDTFDSAPIAHARDFTLAVGAILRPPGKAWFDLRSIDEFRNTEAAIHWFTKARDVMRNYMYASGSRFARSVQEADRDFVTFGNSVLAITENRRGNGILFTTYHLRDCAWSEDSEGEVDTLHRREMYTIRRINEVFGPEALQPGDDKLLDEAPFTERQLRILCMPADQWDVEEVRKLTRAYDPDNPGWVMVYIDPAKTDKPLKVKWYSYFPYRVRRWELGRGSVYATSPVAMVGLPDARMAQKLSQITLEAAEKQLDPPNVAKRDAVLEGPNLFAGGTTWVELEQEQRMSDAFQVLDLGKNAAVGLDMQQDLRARHGTTWHINKLSLPITSQMTAYEVDQRIEEYIRTIGPVIEPFENENGRDLDVVFTLLASLRVFGPPEYAPEEIRGTEIKFQFETPVQQAYERRKILALRESIELATAVASAAGKPDVFDNIDSDAMARQGMTIIAGEAEWVIPPDEVVQQRVQRMQEAEEMKAKQEQMVQLEMMERGAKLVPALAGASDMLSQLLGPDWMQGLMAEFGGGQGGPQGQGNRLLPPPGEDVAEQQGQVLPPMAQQAARGAAQPGFAGPMPRDAAQQPPAGMWDSLAQAINNLAAAQTADTILITDDQGRPVGSRKVMRSQADATEAYAQ